MAHILQEYKAYSLQGHAVAHKYVQTIYTYTHYVQSAAAYQNGHHLKGAQQPLLDKRTF